METTKIRRPSSAYLFYCLDVRSTVKDANPESKSTEITKLIGNMWKGLTDVEKEPYLKKASEDRDRFLKEKQEANASKIQKPKRPLTAYMVFSNKIRPTIRENNPGITLGDVSKRISEQWKVLTDEQKTEYVDESKKDKERYDTEMMTFTEMSASAPPTQSPPSEKKKKKKKSN
jgi:hypothetical protein